MGKTILYLVLLAVLGTGVYFFLFRNSDSLYSEQNANFTIRDTGAIGKIFMVQNDGESLLIERDSTDNWIINKKYPAMSLQITNLLNCFRQQAALTPVSEKEHDRVIKLLASIATKVEVYDRQNKKIRTFFVAGQGPNYHGSYMILEGSDQPFLVEIPGFHGYLSPRYTTDLAAWRARYVFNIPAQQIRSISVHYDAEPLSSFTVAQDNGKVRVDVDPQLHDIATELNEIRAKEYLNLFTDINCEGYVNGLMHMDSLIAVSPKQGTIEVTTTTGAKQTLDLYRMPPTSNTMDPVEKEAATEDIDRMYAILQHTHDTMIIQLRTFNPLLRRSYEFYAKDDTVKNIRPQVTPLRNKLKIDRM